MGSTPFNQLPPRIRVHAGGLSRTRQHRINVYNKQLTDAIKSTVKGEMILQEGRQDD